MRTYRVDRMKDIRFTGEPRDGDIEFNQMDIKSYANRAFSMMSGKNIFLIVLSILLVAVLTVFLIRKPDANPLMRYGFWMVIAGGIGNLYDRIAYGFVVDFIRLDFVRFAIFNPADVFICLGAAFAAVSVLADEMKGKKKHG